MGVSAATGEGMDELFEKIDACRDEYEREYRPVLEELQARRQRMEQAAEEARKAEDVERLGKDIRGLDI